jgi:DNA-binding CsgD family transcriptional regulator/tetratricopeptide (TPR) repeat protein
LDVSRRVTCPDFVGREEELARLAATAHLARTSGQLVVVGGDAGVGKTRLITEATSRWRAGGGAAVIGGCVDVGGMGVGYAPLREVVRRLRSELDADLVDSLLHEVAPGLLPLLSGGSAHTVAQDAVLAHALSLLEAIGDLHSGLMVVFEDLHWADASTRDLVAFLARTIGTAKVVLVLTYRIDDLHSRHPLRPLLAELSRSPAVEQLSLSGMSHSELSALLRGIASEAPPAAVVDDIHLRSEGNPFFAEELFSSGGARVPAGLRELVLANVGALPDDVQRTLRQASVLDGAIDDRLLAMATQRPEADIGEHLRSACAAHVLVVDADGCRFRHALVREALYADVLPGERQRLHESVADCIERHPELASADDHIQWAVVAHHWGAGENQPKAFAASVLAALGAEHVGALADAVAHYQRALELWSRVPDPEAAAGMSQAELLLRAADATVHAGSPARAVSLAEAALDLLPASEEAEVRAAALERLGNHRWVARDAAGSEQARTAAVDLLADRPASEAKAQALASLGRHHMLTDQFLAAEPLLRRAIEVADAVGSAAARSASLSGLGFTLVKLGRADEGVAAGYEALAIAEHEGTADELGRAYVNLSGTLVAAGRCEEAVRVVQTGLDHARRVGMLASDGVLLAYAGAEAHFWLGNWDAAVALVESQPFVDDRPHGTTRAVVARIAFHRGQDELSARHCELARDTSHGVAQQLPDALACAGQLAARAGDFDLARRHLTQAVASVRGSEDVFLILQLYTAAMQVEADRLEWAQLQGPRSPAVATSGRSSADELMDAGRSIVERLSGQGVIGGPESVAQTAFLEAEHGRASGRLDPDEWAAVAAHWDALHFPYPAAVAHYRRATALLSGRGNRAQAADLVRGALATADRLTAAPLAESLRLLAQRGRLDLATGSQAPPPARDVLEELGVSAREREVLDLVAAGRTNRQIGAQLYISEKTASVHVTHLLRKLGVSSRIEAAAMAQRLRPDA